jgi:Mg2+-importing ATPase
MNTTDREENSVPHFTGLTHEEAAKRLLTYGENTIYHRARLRPIIAFIKKFNSPLLLLLIGAAIISYFLGQRVNATIIIVMVAMSAILDFVNSHKSERVAEMLIARVQSTATVWRNGAKEEIPFHLLVPGDVIELSSGDVIPADCRVIAADDLFVNQSSLTGESFPVEKRALVAAAAGDQPLAIGDEHALFMGTSVVTGRGTAEVLHTGEHAEFGKIAARLAGAEGETSFDRSLKDFSIFIVRLTFVMILVVFGVNAYFGRGVLDSFIFAMAIAVGITPELLPVIMSVALSHGSLVMAKKNVIVKNLGAVQNFGGMNILCTDKTGTLTEDKITLVKCVDLAGKVSSEVMRYAALSSSYQTIRKGPLDIAIMEHGAVDLGAYTKIDEVPFDFTRRRDSIVAEHEGERMMITKGAPESMTDICDCVMDNGACIPITELEKKKVRAEYDRLSADGFRVLAVAMKVLPMEERAVYHREEETGMIFLGFAAFLDPPKQSAGLAIKELEKLSIEVKIITGDSEVLTEHICQDLGFVVRGVLTGEEVSKLSDSELMTKAQVVNVFARTSPEQKERIVGVLRQAGNTVGYLGDGINDAPVLRAADVGISVNNAVDVAKETADIILLDKSLSVLKDGVVEGRKTFQNTLKYIKMGFSSNFGNMFSMMGASIFLPFLPMLPSQILLNNFLYDLSGTTLPTDHTDPESMQAPLKWNMREFSKYILVFGVVSSLFDFLTFYLLFAVFHMSEMRFQTGWFIESIATQVLIIFIIRTKRTPSWKSKPSRYLVLSAASVVSLAWVIPYTPLGELFSFTALPPILLLAIVGIVATYLVVGETVKYFFYRRYALAP